MAQSSGALGDQVLTGSQQVGDLRSGSCGVSQASPVLSFYFVLLNKVTQCSPG